MRCEVLEDVRLSQGITKIVDDMFFGCSRLECLILPDEGQQSVEDLNAMGINAHYSESTGTAHEWLTWRRCLNEFIPHIFKK